MKLHHIPLRSLRAAAIVTMATVVPHASAFSLSGTAWDQAPNKTDPNLLYAIALTESKKTDASGKAVTPWPWSVNFKGKGYYFDTRIEAESFVQDKLDRGYKNIDIGVMQVNYRWHAHRVNSPMDLFDIKTAVRVGEEILMEAMSSAPGDQALGIGRYHNWTDVHRSRSYGQAVLHYQSVLKKITQE